MEVEYQDEFQRVVSLFIILSLLVQLLVVDYGVVMKFMMTI